MTKRENFYIERDGQYYCTLSGNQCLDVKLHFDDYARAVKHLAELEVNAVFPNDCVPDLCTRVLECVRAKEYCRIEK